MVGTRRKRSESKSKALAVVPEEPEPLQIINAEAVNGPSDDESEKNDSLEPVYVGGYHEEKQMTEEEELEEEEQVTDEIYEEEELEINDITSNGNEDVHTEDEEEVEDEEPVSGGSDNEDVLTEDEEKEEEVEEENEDNEEQEQKEDEVEEQEENEEEPDEDEVEEQEEYEEEEYEEEEEEEENEEKEEEEEKLASCGSDNEDVRAFEEVGADVTACFMNTNEVLTSHEHVLVENLTDNLNDEKEANEPMAEEPISIPAENGGDKSIEEIASTFVEAKSVAEQGSQPKTKIIRRRLIKKNTSHGNEGTGVSCNAGTSNAANLLSLEDDETVGVASEKGKNEKGKNEKKVVRRPIVKVNKKLNSVRKENQNGQSSAQTGSVEQKPKLTNNKPASKENKTSEQEFTNEEVERSEARFTRKQKNKRIVEEGTQIIHANDIDEPESSKKSKLWKRVESQGMIFMCSSDTKKDCFRYKVFGLSAAKKDLVSKIYKGMRLFLFDVNLRMLYGIYKAAGRGSYDIEPRAFHSQFPSQVRFTILKDCLPIPEGKFKKVIKDNYFTNTKFHCQLTKDQVKNLCKLFNESAKKSAFKQDGPSQKPRPIDTSSTRVDRKRKRVEDSRRVERRPISSQDPGRRRRLPEQARRSSRTHMLRGQEEMRRPIVVRSREEPRLAPVVIDERYRHPAVIYDRDAYLPSVESSALYKPYRAEDSPRSRTYSYERSPRIDHYRRESAIDYRDHEISRPRESRHYVQQTVHDPYTIYREPGVYHEPVYDSYPSPERRSSKYYRPSDEYCSPVTDRRRY